MKHNMAITIITALCLALCGTAAPAFAKDQFAKRVETKTRELLARYGGPTGVTLLVVNAGDDDVSRSVTGMVTDRLTADKRFTVVERESIGMVLDEVALQNTGIIPPEVAAKVGQIAPAKAALIVSRDDNLVSLRIVMIETGRVMSFVQFPLREEAVVKIEKKEPVIDRRYYHSPVIAALVSVFPVYSGSWNARFTEAGMFLVAAKSLSPAPVGYFAYELKRRKDRYYDRRNRMNELLTLSFVFTPSDFGRHAALGYLAIQDEKRGVRRWRKLYRRWGRYCAYAWAGATAADIIHSAFYMVWWNKKYAYVSARRGGDLPTVSFDVEPRNGDPSIGPMAYLFPEGLDIVVTRRF